MFYAQLIFKQVIHWLFAIEYYTVVTNLGNLMKRLPEDEAQHEDEKAKRFVIKMNFAFYVSLIIWALSAEFSANKPVIA